MSGIFESLRHKAEAGGNENSRNRFDHQVHRVYVSRPVETGSEHRTQIFGERSRFLETHF